MVNHMVPIYKNIGIQQQPKRKNNNTQSEFAEKISFDTKTMRVLQIILLSQSSPSCKERNKKHHFLKCASNSTITISMVKTAKNGSMYITCIYQASDINLRSLPQYPNFRIVSYDFVNASMENDKRSNH